MAGLVGGWVGGWVAGEVEIKAISAFNWVEVEVEAELGKKMLDIGVHCPLNSVASRPIDWQLTPI